MTGIAFLDSTKLGVCHNRRIGAHRVFDGLARRGKTSGDWFFGFKLHLVVKPRKNMKNKLISVLNKVLIPSRVIIENVIDYLKNVAQVEHSRHRSPRNFVVNFLSALAAYSFEPQSPSFIDPINPIFLSNSSYLQFEKKLKL